MRAVKWVIRFAVWLLFFLLTMSKLAGLIKLPLIELNYDEWSVLDGNVFTSNYIYAFSLFGAFCFAFYDGIKIPIKRAVVIYLIPLLIIGFLKLINYVTDISGISNMPVINIESANFVGVFAIIFGFYFFLYCIHPVFKEDFY